MDGKTLLLNGGTMTKLHVEFLLTFERRHVIVVV